MHFIERLLDTIQNGNGFFCGNISTDRSENRLVAQHHRTVLYICVINILPVIISGGKIAHDEIFPFCRTHIGKWGGFEEILFINLYYIRIILDCHTAAGQCGDFLFIIITPLPVAGVVIGREDFTDKVSGSIAFFSMTRSHRAAPAPGL